MERYIGMDVHAASCTLAVISEKGRRLKDFPLGNLDGLANCKNLESTNTYEGFSLSSCHSLEDVGGLSDCKKITEVMFSNSNRTSLPRGLEKITNLQTLRLSENQSLENIDGLAACEGLREVSLQGCESLANVVGLVGCKKLAGRPRDTGSSL
jgi:Leucine-rich repeat (LRR) protein